jgi:NADP-dependent 3-hydroxy acid dehydrogenase YdfG
MSSVLITGASKGIGRAVAEQLAAKGHRVVATGRDAASLDGLEVAEKLALDVNDEASVNAAVAAAGEVDVLFANAGIMAMGAVEAVAIAEAQAIFNTNVFGTLRVVRAVAPRMRERGSGRIILASSILGRAVLPGFAAYSASKWAIEAYGEGLAMELGGFGIEVVVAEPGPVASGLVENMPRVTLDDDPYKLDNPIVPEIMIPTEEAAADYVELVEADTVPLRRPIGAFTEDQLGKRDKAPFDKPWFIGSE